MYCQILHHSLICTSEGTLAETFNWCLLFSCVRIVRGGGGGPWVDTVERIGSKVRLRQKIKLCLLRKCGQQLWKVVPCWIKVYLLKGERKCWVLFTVFPLKLNLTWQMAYINKQWRFSSVSHFKILWKFWLHANKHKVFIWKSLWWTIWRKVWTYDYYHVLLSPFVYLFFQ